MPIVDLPAVQERKVTTESSPRTEGGAIREGGVRAKGSLITEGGLRTEGGTFMHDLFPSSNTPTRKPRKLIGIRWEIRLLILRS